MDLVFRLDWRIPTISIKHFIDHYKRVLPMFDKESSDGKSELQKYSDYFNLDVRIQAELSTDTMKQYFRVLRDEILDCIGKIILKIVFFPLF